MRVFKNSDGVVSFQYKSQFDLQHGRDWRGGDSGIAIFSKEPPDLRTAQWPDDFGFDGNFMGEGAADGDECKGLTLVGELTKLLEEKKKKFNDDDRAAWRQIFDHAWPRSRADWLNKLLSELRDGSSPVKDLFALPKRELPPRQPPRSEPSLAALSPEPSPLIDIPTELVTHAGATF